MNLSFINKKYQIILILITTTLVIVGILVVNFKIQQNSAFAFGNSFYVDPSGVDTNPGTLAQPYATIQKCADVAAAGDTCFIKAGTYRETVKPLNSGVTFKNYNDEKVVISGAEVVANSTFSQHAGNIFKAPLGWSLNVREPYSQSTNNQIFVDGKMMVEARWPNIPVENVTDITNIEGKRQDNARADSASITSSTVASYTDSDLSSAGSFWGSGTNKGKINFNPGFSIMTTTCDIASKNTTSVSFACSPDSGQGGAAKTIDSTPGSMLAPKGNNYYYLWGKLEALDTTGEFFVDPPTDNLGIKKTDKGNTWYENSNNLYLQMPDNSNPTSSNKIIEVRKRMYGFDLTGKSNTTIEGINFFAATINTTANSNNNTFQNLDMKYLWHTQDLPPLFYGDGTVGLPIRGSNNTLKDSTLAYASGTMFSFAAGYQQTNSGNQAINNVVYDMGYGGIGAGYYGGSNDASNKHKIEQNTMFNAGRYIISAESATDILYNDVYNSHLQITDLGAIYGWGTDGKGSDIAYNLVHDVWAQKANDNQFGGHGIYLDDESTDFNIYRNIVWNTTSSGLMLATYRNWVNQHSNTGKTSNNRKAYNNTIDNYLGLLNKCEGSQCGFQTGTEIKNNIFTGITTQPTLESKYGTIDWANNFYGNALFTNKDGQDYTLRDFSPVIDAGLSLSPYTNGSIGTPDIGALERGKLPFVAGAVIMEKNLNDITLTCGKEGTNGTCTINNLPMGRKIPADFKIKIGNGTSGGECVNTTDYTSHQTTTTCKNVDLNGQTGDQAVSVQIGSSNLVTKGTANFDGFKITQVVPNNGVVAGGTNITINGQLFSTSQNAGFSKEISLQNTSGVKLYDYQIPVILDTASLISAGKMRSDCGDLRFNDGFQNLEYWLEEGCNTAQTRVWVKTSYIPDNNNSGKIFANYGLPARTSSSDGRKTFVWFEDFQGPLSPAISLGAQPAGVSVGVNAGEMKISGTNNSGNQYNMFGFGIYQDQLNLPNNFAIDSELQVMQGTNFLANVGSFDGTMTLFGAPSGTPARKDISYYANSWQNVGKSTVTGSSSMPKTKFSFGQFGEKTARTLQWRENGDTQTVLANRTNVNNPTFGYFTFRPGAIQSFDARFDNLRVRNLSSTGIEPTATIGAETTPNVLQIKIDGQDCLNIQIVSSTQITCTTPARASGSVAIQVINPDQSQTILNNAYTYGTPTPAWIPTVAINEINQQGSNNSATDQWIELYNTTNQAVDLTNFVIENLGNSGTPNIVLNSTVCSALTIPANGYFLISKLDKNNSLSNLNVNSDCVITNMELGVPEKLILKNGSGVLVDETP